VRVKNIRKEAMIVHHAYVFMADGMEETECLTIVDLLRRGGVDVTTVSVMKKKAVHTSHGVVIKADQKFKKVDFSDADLLFLPGGGLGVQNLYAHKGLKKLLKSADLDKVYLGAVCAGPSVLGRLGLLKGYHATCYPGFEDQLKGADYTGEGICVDRHIVTGIGLGFCVDLGLRLLAILEGQDVSDKIKAKIQHPDCVAKAADH
jgi:4-methyl-5(b-hydroxyethyl)-thiazole monophosphate biosynthesis